jgi:hypothetical protein
VAYISFDPNGTSNSSGVEQKDPLKSEASYARAALAMKYQNPINPDEQTEVQKSTRRGTRWEGNQGFEP